MIEMLTRILIDTHTTAKQMNLTEAGTTELLDVCQNIEKEREKEITFIDVFNNTQY